MKNNAPLDWKGVYPALTTNFDESGKLDLVTFGANLEKQIESGVHGVVLGGTLGESAVLNSDEKETLLRVTVEICQDRIPVIMNIAEAGTEEAGRSIEKAKKGGASGLMMLPPMRYKASEKEIGDFFFDLAKLSDLPIMIYNNPVDYGNLVSLDHFKSFISLGKIQAVKESTRDVGNITRMKTLFGDRFKILCGVDTLAFESILLGADGWVAGLVCAFPKENMVLYDYLVKGELEKARELNRWFFPLFELDIHPKLVQYIKLAEKQTRLGTEYVRPPRKQLDGSERKKILEIINTAIEQNPIK